MPSTGGMRNVENILLLKNLQRESFFYDVGGHLVTYSICEYFVQEEKFGLSLLIMIA